MIKNVDIRGTWCEGWRAMPLDPVQVENYTNKFLGYGNPNAGWWFIGSEEGGGNSMEEVEARVGVWQESGALPFERVKSMVL